MVESGNGKRPWSTIQPAIKHVTEMFAAIEGVTITPPGEAAVEAATEAAAQPAASGSENSEAPAGEAEAEKATA